MPIWVFKAKTAIGHGAIRFEFGQTQADFYLSLNGKAARHLKLKAGDKVLITIRKA
jgi:hypothetical protein